MRPRWSVVFVVMRGESLLALSRNFDPLDVNFPGGHADDTDKTPDETLRRKVSEETGLKAEAYRRVLSWRGESRQPVHAYVVTRYSGKPRASAAGRPFWARPYQLASRSATFHSANMRVMHSLLQMV